MADIPVDGEPGVTIDYPARWRASRTVHAVTPPAGDLEPVEHQPCPTCRQPHAAHDVRGLCPVPPSDPQTHVPGQMPLPLP